MTEYALGSALVPSQLKKVSEHPVCYSGKPISCWVSPGFCPRRVLYPITRAEELRRGLARVTSQDSTMSLVGRVCSLVRSVGDAVVIPGHERLWEGEGDDDCDEACRGHRIEGVMDSRGSYHQADDEYEHCPDRIGESQCDS